MNWTSLVSAVTIVGLVVLIAMGKVAPGQGLPLIGALAGTHLGVSLTGNSTPTISNNTPVVTDVAGNRGA